MLKPFLATLVILICASLTPQDFVPVHQAIVIDGDSEWTPENGVTGGKGTPEDPYLIEGWTIPGAAQNGIEVKNTRSHAIIKNNQIGLSLPTESGGTGISLYNVSNLEILDNVLTYNFLGVKIRQSSYIATTGNVFSSQSFFGHGLDADQSSDITVSDNVFSNLSSAMGMVDISNFSVTHNTMDNIGRWGSFSIVNSTKGTISTNEITSCTSGISILLSNSTTVEGNYLEDCDRGLYVQGTDGYDGPDIMSSFVDNEFRRMDRAMWFLGCNGCVVQTNLVSTAGIGADLSPNMIFDNNTIKDSSLGIDYFKPIPTHIRNNSLVKNEVNIESEGETLDARFNWYGSKSGPADGSINGNVIYRPWLKHPP